MSRGEFFAIDRRQWAKACGLGMNVAAAYLVQARGTGRDQRLTAWSVQAIETYTGIGRTRAKAAIQASEAANLIRTVQAGSKPRYEILPFSKQGAGNKPEWIWLPNAFVTGAGSETPPLELLRQTQDPMTLRLAVDLYYAQNLAEDGGISRGCVYKQHDRYEVGRQAQYTVWGFGVGQEFVCWNQTTKPHRREKLTKEEKAEKKNPAVDFFPRTKVLADTGLIEWIPHLVESEDAAAEILHPMFIGGDPHRFENRIGFAAQTAAEGLLTENQRRWARDNGLTLAPVPRHMGKVQLVSVARLRYRPHTAMTAAWWADVVTKGEALIAGYEALSKEQRAVKSS